MAGTKSGWEAKRWQMVEAQLKRRDIRDPRVLEAMGSIPRELFIPESLRNYSYIDEPVSIGEGQTISQPYMTALMAQCLELTGVENVLEVGAGCGYHAAVLGRLARQVTAVEIVSRLAADAERNLTDTGLGQNVRVFAGDGSLGCREYAPYDAISVAAAAPEIPDALLEQLNDPGRLVIPVGSMEQQELLVISKSEGSITSRIATRCRFVPLRGGKGWQAP